MKMVHFFIIAAVAIGQAQASVSVTDFCEDFDWADDSGPAIQKVIDHVAENGGGTVLCPAGKYIIDSPVSVKTGVTLKGVWEAPHHAELESGTVMLVTYGDGKDEGPAFTIEGSATIKGMTFFYPEQDIDEVRPYSFTICGKGMHASVVDCTFVNSYKAIDFATHHNELHYIRNCYGSPLARGVVIDKCTDIGRIENVHFNPHYWVRCGDVNAPEHEKLNEYLSNNLIAFSFARTDWEYVLNTFCYGAKIGYLFTESEMGTVNGNFLGIGADWCRQAVVVEDTQMPGLLITNGEFVAREGAQEYVQVESGHKGVVQFSNCSFWGPCTTVCDIDGTGTVSLAQCTFHNWGESEDDYAIVAKGGSVVVNACRFGQPRPDVYIGEKVDSAIVTSCVFRKKSEIDCESDGDVQIGLNVVTKE